MPAPLASAAYDPEYEAYLQQMQAEQAALEANGQTSSAPPPPTAYDPGQDTQGMQAQPNAIAPTTPEAAASGAGQGQASYAYGTGQPYYDTGQAPPEQTTQTIYPAPPAASTPQYPAATGGSQDKYGYGITDSYGPMQDATRTDPSAQRTGATSFGYTGQNAGAPPESWANHALSSTFQSQVDTRGAPHESLADHALSGTMNQPFARGVVPPPRRSPDRRTGVIPANRRNAAGMDNIQSEPTLNNRHNNAPNAMSPETEAQINTVMGAMGMGPIGSDGSESGVTTEDIANARVLGTDPTVGPLASDLPWVLWPGAPSGGMTVEPASAGPRSTNGRLSPAPEFFPAENSINGARRAGTSAPQLPDAAAAAFPPVEARATTPMRGRPGTADPLNVGAVDYPAVDLAATPPEPTTSFRRGNWDALKSTEIPRPTADIKAGADPYARGTSPASRMVEGTSPASSAIPGTSRPLRAVEGTTAAPVGESTATKAAAPKGKKTAVAPTLESTSTADVQVVKDSSGKTGYQVVEKTALGDVPGPTFSSYKEATSYLNGLKKGAPKLRPAVEPEPVEAVKPAPKSSVIVDRGPMTSARAYRELSFRNKASGITQKALNAKEYAQNVGGALPVAGTLAAGLGLYELASGINQKVKDFQRPQPQPGLGGVTSVPGGAPPPLDPETAAYFNHDYTQDAGNDAYGFNTEATKQPVVSHFVPPSAFPRGGPAKSALKFDHQPTADFVPPTLAALGNAKDKVSNVWAAHNIPLTPGLGGTPQPRQPGPGLNKAETPGPLTPITANVGQRAATPQLEKARADMAPYLDEQGNIIPDSAMMTSMRKIGAVDDNGLWTDAAYQAGLIEQASVGKVPNYVDMATSRGGPNAKFTTGVGTSTTVPYDASKPPVDVQTVSGSGNTNSSEYSGSNGSNDSGWVDYGSKKKSYGSGGGSSGGGRSYGGSSGGYRSGGGSDFSFGSDEGFGSGSFDWHNFLDDLNGDGEYSPSEIKAAKKKAKMSRMKGMGKSRKKGSMPSTSAANPMIRKDILDALESSTGKSMPSRKFRP